MLIEIDGQQYAIAAVRTIWLRSSRSAGGQWFRTGTVVIKVDVRSVRARAPMCDHVSTSAMPIC
jgi:hypothetical protein